MPTTAHASHTVPAPARRRSLRWIFLALLAALGSLAVPEVFQIVVGWVVRLEAWRHGVSVRIQRIEGSLWEPVVLVHSYWHREAGNGAITRLEIAHAEAVFSWSQLLQRNGERWWQRLALRGVQGKIHLPFDRNTVRGGHGGWRPRLPGLGRMRLPAVIDVEEIDFIFQSNDDYLRLEDARFSASAVEPGEVRVGKLTIAQPWLVKTFRNVRGQTALQDERLALAGVVFEPGVELRSLTAAPSELAQGQLALAADFAAFDGTLSVEAATKPTGRGVVFEAGGTFQQINIAKLASFLALSDAAGGIIKDGKFTFRGPPRDLSRAQASLRFDAVNFQWETRQWDSLALGAMLHDRRLQVPQFDLRQGRNELHVNGELVLPEPARQWWQGDFNANVKAKIENLTELSALLLPEFKFAAGRAEIEGSVRGRGEEFNGQLLIEGSKLTWRNAPIETLHAAVKLNGKEINIANLDLANRDDYLRGRGVIKLSDPPVYRGELRVAVDDLANYAAFLQKPVLPEPLAGGAVIDWIGEGSKAGHSGKFLARLRKVRTLGALAQQLHPINADLEASYAPGSMQFSQFALSDDDSSFSANVAVGGQALHLQKIRFTHRGAVQLEGSALLPLDVWQQWPNVSIEQLLNEDVASRVQLTAHNLDLAEAALLTGWKFPLDGVLDGTLTADGPLTALKLGGTLTLKDGHLPLGWSGDAVENVSAKLTFLEGTASIEQFSAAHTFGAVEITGTLDFAKLLDPALQIRVRSPQFTTPLFGPRTSPIKALAALDLTVTGQFSAAQVTGQAQLTDLKLGAPLNLAWLWDDFAPAHVRPPFVLQAPPWDAWTFNVTCEANERLKQTTSISGQVTGSGSRPAFVGMVDFRNVPPGTGLPLRAFGIVPDLPLHVQTASAVFRESDPFRPAIDVSLTSSYDGHRFTAQVAGPLGYLLRTYESTPPMTSTAVRELLAGNPPARPQTLQLEITPPIALESDWLRSD
jgi:hypothetical protein